MKNLFYSSLVLALITMLLFSLSCKKDEDDVNNEKTALVVPVDFGSIQAAIDASSDGDTIFVQEGTYKENITFKGKKILVQSLAPENSDIVNNTVIDGNGQGTVVTFNSGETEASILNGFKIINGDAGTSDGGGIIITNASTPVIKNNVISNNTAKYGGGILVSGEANPLIQNNIFESNISESSRGAAIYVINKSFATIENNTIQNHVDVDGVIHIGSTSTDESYADISGNTIQNNTTDFGTGGIKVTAASSADITNNTITDNVGLGDYSAGGITISKNSQANILNNTLTGNSAKSNGAIVIHDESDANIADNTITGNSAGDAEENYGTGGGVTVTYNSTADISDNIISENEAWSLNHGGGGIYISYSSTVTINNNQITNNTAYRYGGGIYVRFNDNYVTITNNEITGNQADGYGAANGGGVYLRNIVEAYLYGNSVTDNWAEKYCGGIYIDNSVAVLKGSNNEDWAVMNYPPQEEIHNIYSNNTHGDDTYMGAHVFFDN